MIFGRAIVSLLAALLLSTPWHAAVAQPSFDCGKAHGPVERAVCSSAELSQLDRALTDAYAARSKAAGGEAGSLRARQRSWLTARSALCYPAGKALPPSPGEACLALLYRKRIAELKDGAPAATYWQAESNTAMSITGDLLLSDASVMMAGGYQLSLQHARSLPKNTAVDMAGFAGAQSLELYRIADAKPRTLLNGNELCSAQQPATYVVVATSNDSGTLSLAFFQGAKEPVWEKTALSATHDLCGTFSYGRAAR